MNKTPGYEPTADIPDAMNSCQRAMKRVLDIFAAALGLILLSPLFIYIATRLRLTEGSPVLFVQERIGYKGRPFNIYKFRTMRKTAEEDGPQLTKGESDALTPFCQCLRNYHLDELPQLWNVLIGDMSMVGPRPERAFFIKQIMAKDARYVNLYKLRPGVTSEATLYNGYTDTIEKMLLRLNMDLNYLRTRSLRKDVAILFKTAEFFITGKRF